MTPLQMAEVAATVANGGELMRPTSRERRRPRRPDVKSSAERAGDRDEAGDGGRAQRDDEQRGRRREPPRRRPSGHQVAGKTGTAEIRAGRNQAWFIAFAPADDPQIAIAVTIELHTGLRRHGGGADREAGDGDAC